MKNPMTVLIGLKTCLEKYINEYLEGNNELQVSVPPFTVDQIVIDTPDIDKLAKNNMIYLIPDYQTMQPQTTCTSRNDNSIKVWLFCKRDKNENLVARACCIYSSILQVILNHRTLDGAVDLVEFTNSDFYPAITASNTISAFEINLTCTYIMPR